MLHWDVLIDTLDKQRKSQRTKEYVTGTLRRILKHAYDRRIIDSPPPNGKRVGVKSPGNSNRRLRVINPAEAEAILSQIKELDLNDYHTTKFAFLTGCRASEAFNLRWRDVNFDQGKLTFPETKNRDPRELPLSKFLKTLLSNILQGKPDDFVFKRKNGSCYKEAPYSFRRTVKNLKFNEGYDPRNQITFHSIRHTVATNLANKLNPRDLMDIMGWRTVQMAMRYVHGNEILKRTALEELTNYSSKKEANVINIKTSAPAA